MSWKTGACHASVSRRAIVLRVDVSSTTSYSGWRARRRGRGSRPDRRLLHVLRDDAALRPGADDLREVDAALAGDPPRERARLDGLPLGTSGRLGLLLSLGCLLAAP